MVRILFVGPLPPPVHGQAVAFEEAYLNVDEIKYVVNQNFENLPLLKKIVYTFFSLFKLSYFLLFKKIDIVYFTCSRSSFGSIKDLYLLLFSSLMKKKIVNHLHGADLESFYNNLKLVHKKILHFAYDKIDVSIVLLPGMKSQFFNIWPHMNVEVIPNFYDKHLNCINKKDEHRIVELLYLSNIIASKGIFDLLDAIKLLDENSIDYNLTIAGAFMCDKEVRNTFTTRISENKNISYIGVIRGDKKIKALKDSDLFVLPTYYPTEAFPLSILEAMRAGNAVITTDHNYLPEVMTDSMGIMVPVKDPTSIYRAINKYIENRELLKEVQVHNMLYAEKHFSSENYIARLDQVFIKVLNS